MDQRDIDLLEQNGWEVECESPFEIRHEETNSFATNAAAYTILSNIRDNNGDTPTRKEYTFTINDDINFLLNNCPDGDHTQHIIEVLEQSIELIYGH